MERKSRAPSFLVWMRSLPALLSWIILLIRPVSPFILGGGVAPLGRHTKPRRINDELSVRKLQKQRPISAASDPHHVETILFVECGELVLAHRESRLTDFHSLAKRETHMRSVFLLVLSNACR